MAAYNWPCPASSRISSPYGWRNCPYHGREFHRGIDIAAAYGSAIYAAKAGTVAIATYNKSYGNTILINHGGGIQTRYAHASKLLVKAGQKVTGGQQIAKVGSTGNSTGNHLHFEIIVNGATINPAKAVKYGDKVTAYSSSSSPGSSGSSGGSSGGGGSSSGGIRTNTGGSTVVEVVRKDITNVVLKSTAGQGANQADNISGQDKVLDTGVEILIQNDRIYLPAVVGDVTLERPRKGAPATLKFTVVKDGILNFQEGNPVSMRYRGEKVFFGYVFSKDRKDSATINVTCYDQIRYLKSEDTLSYADKTYGELLKMIAADYGLQCGTVEDTVYKIKSRIEECTLLDMLGNASDETVLNKGTLFVLYDDFGKLTLQNIQSMKLPIVIDADTAETFDYKSTIDDKTYTRVKLAVDNETTGNREVYVYNDEETQRKWGRLQYYEKLSGGTAAELKERAEVLLKYYGKKHRNLRINGAFGDARVRGGSSLVVMLNLGDMETRNYMVVENVKHKWSNGSYTMDLTMIGIKGEFTA